MSIRMEAGRADAGGDARARQRLVPRLGLAAGAAAAPPRHRGALRLGLPDSAHPDVKSLDGPSGPPKRLHRPARLVRGLPARARAGSASIRPRGCSPAKATFRSPARPSPRAPRRSPALTEKCEVEFSHEMKRRARARGAARHQALHRGAVARDRRARPPRRRRPRARTTCA